MADRTTPPSDDSRPVRHGWFWRRVPHLHYPRDGGRMRLCHRCGKTFPVNLSSIFARMIVLRWNELTSAQKADLMAAVPDLYFAVARFVAHREVTGA